jgi:hypothetical protein
MRAVVVVERRLLSGLLFGNLNAKPESNDRFGSPDLVTLLLSDIFLLGILKPGGA